MGLFSRLAARGLVSADALLAVDRHAVDRTSRTVADLEVLPTVDHAINDEAAGVSADLRELASTVGGHHDTADGIGVHIATSHSSQVPPAPLGHDADHVTHVDGCEVEAVAAPNHRPAQARVWCCWIRHRALPM